VPRFILLKSVIAVDINQIKSKYNRTIIDVIKFKFTIPSVFYLAMLPSTNGYIKGENILAAN
jgi:hypothetical protein